MFIIIIFCLLLFIGLLLVRAVLFTPVKEESDFRREDPEVLSIDKKRALLNMKELIRCKTVSYSDKSLEDSEPFELFPDLLKKLYPHIHSLCTQEKIGDRALLYRWKGRHDENPSIFMAHFDVVPANEALWKHPPFEAIEEDGLLWGRGTLDTKGTLLSTMEAAELLIKEGFIPENDIYFAFGGDEEISGHGASDIVAEIQKRGIIPAFIMDEGGAIVDNVFPGVTQRSALIGIAEKGFLNVRLSLFSAGGHASMPLVHTPVGILAKAVTDIENNPFPFRLTPPVLEMFDTLGRHSSFTFKILFANLWLFAPVLNLLCKKKGGALNALVRTTCAFTQMKGSDTPNVLPPKAEVVANMRLIGGETVETAIEHHKNSIKNSDIIIEALDSENPSNYSKTDNEAYTRLTTAIKSTWKDVIVSPYLMVACSDSRHYSKISDRVYRFSAMYLSEQERGLIHGNDERIPIETLYTAIEFYIRLMRSC